MSLVEVFLSGEVSVRKAASSYLMMVPGAECSKDFAANAAGQTSAYSRAESCHETNMSSRVCMHMIIDCSVLNCDIHV